MGQVVYSGAGTYSFSPSANGLSAGQNMTVAIFSAGGNGAAGTPLIHPVSGGGGAGGGYGTGTYQITTSDVINNIPVVVGNVSSNSSFEGSAGSASLMSVASGGSGSGQGGSVVPGSASIGANFSATASYSGGDGGAGAGGSTATGGVAVHPLARPAMAGHRAVQAARLAARPAGAVEEDQGREAEGAAAAAKSSYRGPTASSAMMEVKKVSGSRCAPTGRRQRGDRRQLREMGRAVTKV
jgi:hypothetical protein